MVIAMNKVKKQSPKLGNLLFPIVLIIFHFCFGVLLSAGYQESSFPEKNEVSRPHLLLFGVIVAKNIPSMSLAALKDESSGKIKVLKTGDGISGFTLIHVFKNRIVLQKDAQTYQVFLNRNVLIPSGLPSQKNIRQADEKQSKDKVKLFPKAEENQIRMEFVRSEVEKRIKEEWPLIVQETRFVPNQIDGRISGFKITKLPRSSILTEIGIRKDDVIRAINNVEIDDTSNLFSLYNELKYDNQIEITVEREGKLFRITYTLK